MPASNTTLCADFAIRLSSALRLLLDTSTRLLAHNTDTYAFALLLKPTPISVSSEAILRASENTGSPLHIEDIHEAPYKGIEKNNTTLPSTTVASLLHRSVTLITMSIKNGQSEPANGEQQAARSSLFANVKTYLNSLGLPTGHLLTNHAVDHHHEDVPDELETESQAASTVVSTRTPSPINEIVAPGRLISLFPPINYGAVVPGSVYRSGYPATKNYGFLKSLKLKTIITLVPEEISPEYRDFMKSSGIQHFQVHINANKGGVRVQSCDINRALNIILDRTNHPILIHCNKGKHRTGCVVATLRKIQGLEMDSIRHEYHTYANPKARFWDEVFFEHFDLNTVMWLARRENWIIPEIAPLSPPPSPVSALGLMKTPA